MDIDDPTTIPAALERAAARFGDLEGLVDETERLTFAEVATRADEVARALIASGIDPGDRVAIWAPNSVTWPLAALGVYRAGAAVVPLNTRFKGSEARYILERSGARLLFTVTDFLDLSYVDMLTEAGRPESLEQIVVISGPVPEGAVSFADFLARAADVADDAAAIRAEKLTADDLSDLIFTSGTTGQPKGAMLRHGASVRAYTAWSDVVGLQEGDRYLIINPFFHAFGLKAGLLAALLKGATIIPHAVFDVPSVMKRVEEEKISMLPGPPAIYMTILDHPDLSQYDLSTLRLSVTGAATIPVEMIRRMRSELTFKNIVTGYGLTESTGIATMCRHDDDPEIIATTAGRPIPDVEVLIVAPDGTPRPAGEPGEVVIRGYNVMKGYFGDPGETAATIDDDGWLHTGDIGIFDEGGNLRITDRTKDMFISGGFNAYPAEIEGIVMEHPGVGQVAVIGVPDHRMGEVGKAFIIRRPGAEVTEDELKAWCREHMANYKAPRYIEFVDSLPLNAAGKVLKFELRDRSTEGT